jgi:hypothetical protein
MEEKTIMAEKRKLSDLEIFEIEKEALRKDKLRKKAVIDQVLRFLGLLLASMIFLITFSMTVGLTLFGYIFGLNPYTVWAEGLPFVFQSGSIYYAFIGPDQTVAVLLMTFIQITLGAALGILVSYYIKDLFGIIKSILRLAKDTVIEGATNVKDGVVDIVVLDDKKLFPEEDKKIVKEEKKKKEKQQTVEVKPVQPAVNEEDLDKLLTDPNYKPAPTVVTTQPNPNATPAQQVLQQATKKSLFDPK